MEQIKLFDSELRLMEIIWSKSPVSAKEISLIAAEEIGWNKNTTYTVLTTGLSYRIWRYSGQTANYEYCKL